jgi:hypothetical protein
MDVQEMLDSGVLTLVGKKQLSISSEQLTIFKR